jgi:hypothetical protein
VHGCRWPLTLVTGYDPRALARTAKRTSRSRVSFYATASAVIRVLFLALAVQDTICEELLKAPAKTLLGTTDDLLRYARAPSVSTGRP